MSHIRVVSRRLSIATAMLAGLAACQTNTGDAPTAASTPSATAQGSAPAQSGENRVNLAQCSTPSDGNVFFKVGQAVVSVPANIVGDVIPSTMKPPLQREVVKAELQKQAAAGGGCPGKPIDASLLLMRDNLGHPLLEGTIGLVRTPPKAAAQRFAQLTAQLQAKPNRNCKTIGGELLACVGTETRGQQETPVMYVITTDKRHKMQSGGPLAVRCRLDGQKIAGCNIVDHLAGGVTFDATLNAGDYSTAGLLGARDAAARRVEQLRSRGS